MPRARTIGRIVFATTALLVAVPIAFSAYRLHAMRKDFEAHAARGREALAAHRQEFMDDQRFLAGLAFFAPRTSKRDAGPLIGPRVRWMSVNPGDATGSASDTKPDQTDLAWMARLAEYDHWDVDQNSVPSDSRFFHDAEPNPGNLVSWAELRIAKGIQDGAVRPALSEVEELARLCFTTERVATELYGLAILGRARKARERFAIKAPAHIPDRDSIPRIKRALFGAMAFARLGTPASYEADFSRIAVGRCAALHDGLQVALQVRSQLRDSHSADYQHMDRLLAAAPDCRLSSLRRRWALPDDEPMFQPDGWWERVTMRWIPGLRRYPGEVLLAISEQDWFRSYEDPAGSTAP